MFVDHYVSNSSGSFRNLKLKTQILIICLVFSIIILGIQIAIIFIGQNILKSALQDRSDQIFYTQSKTLLNNIWIQKQSMEEVIESTKHQIQVMRQLYQFVESNQKFKIGEPYLCLNDPKQEDQYCHTESTCCGMFGEIVNDEIYGALNTIMSASSLLNVFRLEFDFNKFSSLYFNFNNSAQFYCKSWSVPLNSSFHPFKRPYYMEYLQQLTLQNAQEFFFANPYIAVIGQVRCPIVTSLLNVKYEFKGIIVKDLDFNYSQIQKRNQFQNFIINKQGLVIFSEKYRQTNVRQFYLSESQYSGFNEFDQEQILKKHFGEIFQSNCNNFQSKDILCLYNSDLNKNVIVQTANITNSPFILTILEPIDEMQSQKGNIQHCYKQKLIR